ncbi:MAG: glycosyltransferase family 39 protein [Candidatus Lernaella stagnicola]|nr:glycosyltransferase family 39 protein [Candidatus Lernaella stagnicola]
MQDFDKNLNQPALDQGSEPSTAARPALWAWLTLAALWLGWFLAQILWWMRFRFPYGAQIGYEAAVFGRQLAAGEYAEVLSHLKISNYYPPLYEFTLGLFDAFFGFHLSNGLLLNSVFVALTCVAVFLLVRRWADDTSALLAAVLILGHDMAFSSARIPMREVAVMAVVAWTLLFLQNRKLLWHPALSLSIAVLLAAGLMYKWTFAIYAALPVGATFLWLIWREERRRWRPVVLAAFATLVILALCIPWYVFVLDLKYLAVSSANDPHPDPLLWQIPFYPHALGIRYLGDTAAGWALLALAALGALINLRQRFIPALSLFGGWLILFLIPHNEERYVLGLLPALAVLVALAFHALPRRLWMRLSILVALVLVMAGSFHQSSFARPRFSYDSGAIRTLAATNCQRDGYRLAAKIIRQAAELGEKDAPAQLATHPLNRHFITFNQDILPLMIWQFGLGDKVAYVGYDLTGYTAFDSRLDEIDVLVVGDIVWKASTEFLNQQMAAWKDFRKPDWEVKNRTPGDPQRRGIIERDFEKAYTHNDPCIGSIHVYVRRTAQTDVPVLPTE